MKMMHKLALAVAALAAPVVMSGSVMADTVSYRTYGTFTAGPTSNLGGPESASNATGFSSTAVGPLSTLTALNGGVVSPLSLSFTGVGPTQGISLPFPGASFQLGSFNLTGLNGTFSGTDSFTIFINQISPASTPNSSSQSSVASVTGSVTGTGGQAVVFTFSPTVLTFGNEQYTLPSFVGVDESMATGNSLTAEVVGPALSPGTPLPKAAMAGVGLLGLLGLSKLRRPSAVA